METVNIELSREEIHQINGSMLEWNTFVVMKKVQERILHELEKNKIPENQGEFEF